MFFKHVLNLSHLGVQSCVEVVPCASFRLAHVGGVVLNVLIQGVVCVVHSILKYKVMKLDVVICVLLVFKDWRGVPSLSITTLKPSLSRE